jgi:hypothetical protein
MLKTTKSISILGSDTQPPNDGEGFSLDEMWSRFSPMEVVSYALDASRSINAVSLSQRLNQCDGLERCRAILVCELDHEGCIMNYAIATRSNRGFESRRSFVCKDDMKLSVELPYSVRILTDSCVACSSSDPTGESRSCPFQTSDDVYVELEPGQIHILFFGWGLNPDALLGLS